MTDNESRLHLWTMPKNYSGESWPGYYVFLTQHRDSDLVTRSNFISALAELGGESDTVRVVRESHWLVGWLEWIAIHQDDVSALAKAENMGAKIKIYPILDEDRYSSMEYDYVYGSWNAQTLVEKIEVCVRFGVSIFAARRSDVPDRDCGGIFDYLRGC
ncbi:hypothetical protein UFOVP1299_76 [uncultured Caudovirales phage]|uniref:Uncharacterized protein n=1 Tax=uncultured Caudovirales phage TaxID=2100421 RepID=A0A6J5RRT1_9CAUD|nr:hypothetical protein UFOVP1299_76 [uncultured Caudovirales phage]